MGNLWESARFLSVQTGQDIVGGFDVGFDGKIPEETKNALMDFIYWAEDHYHMPITLWVDFKYSRYLIGRDKKRTAYRFYWVDYASLTAFDNYDDIPVIEFAARVEKQSVDALLRSLIEAISHYFAWLTGADLSAFSPDEALTGEILRQYKNYRGE